MTDSLNIILMISVYHYYAIESSSDVYIFQKSTDEYVKVHL